MTALQITWFFLIALFIFIYAVLDGFDLGMGILYTFGKSEPEKQKILKRIGPVWDGNEVWLLLAGGALFAAFPRAYAVIFSELYLPLTLIIVSLIIRAICIEFRNAGDGNIWRLCFDIGFSASSNAASFLFGASLVFVLKGGVWHWSSLLGGFAVVALFAWHGLNYLRSDWQKFTVSAFVILSIVGAQAVYMFPNFWVSRSNGGLVFNIANSSSSALALKYMLIVAAIGMPFVIIYNLWLYKLLLKKTGSAS